MTPIGAEMAFQTVSSRGLFTYRIRCNVSLERLQCSATGIDGGHGPPPGESKLVLWSTVFYFSCGSLQKLTTPHRSMLIEFRELRKGTNEQERVQSEETWIIRTPPPCNILVCRRSSSTSTITSTCCWSPTCHSTCVQLQGVTAGDRRSTVRERGGLQEGWTRSGPVRMN